MNGPVPGWLVTASVAIAVFTLMFSLGLGIAVGELRWIWRRPGPMLRGLFCVLVAVPAIALLIGRALDLARTAQVAMALMAISPGAPVSLRRSLGAGGHPAFAPSLQIASVLAAVVSMPLSIAALNEFYLTRASIMPWDVARQILVAQLVPLGLGMALRRWRAPLAERIKPRLDRIGNVLLIATVVLVLVDAWEVTVTAGARTLAAIVLITFAALAAGHLLGGPEPEMRTAVAITSAARNPGLALLVTTQNNAPAAVNAGILAYLLVSVLAIVPYVQWRQRAARRAEQSAH